MYKHILVAIDASPVSDNLIHEAIKLARNEQSKIDLLHIVDLSLTDSGGMWAGLEEYIKTIKQGGKLLLSKMSSKISAASIPVESHCIEMTDNSQSIAQIILKMQEKSHHDLLIIGTHGRRGFRRFLLGSVAEEIIRSANVPILLIRQLVDEE